MRFMMDPVCDRDGNTCEGCPHYRFNRAAEAMTCAYVHRHKKQETEEEDTGNAGNS